LLRWVELLKAPTKTTRTKRSDSSKAHAHNQHRLPLPLTLPSLSRRTTRPPTLVTDILDHELAATGVYDHQASHATQSRNGAGYYLNSKNGAKTQLEARPRSSGSGSHSFYTLCAAILSSKDLQPRVAREANTQLHTSARNATLRRLGVLTAELLMRYLQREDNPTMFAALFNLILLMLDGKRSNRVTMLRVESTRVQSSR
jgi:hypothetical protein